MLLRRLHALTVFATLALAAPSAIAAESSKTTTKKKLFPYTVQDEPFSYPAQKMLEIEPAMLADCLALETKKASSDFRLDQSKMNKKFDYQEFLRYLHADSRRNGDYETGQEPALQKWILEQPDNSIDPVKIYGEAIRLADGNAWNALATIHQLLRNHARWWNDEDYHFKSDRTQARTFWNKFIDIRGDLQERGRPHNGDHEGSWYRIWGMMLYRMMQLDGRWLDFELAQSPLNNAGKNCDQGLTECSLNIYCEMKANVISFAAEAVKPLLHMPITDWRKAELNRVGAGAATRMISKLWDQKFTSENPYLEKSCKEREYLLEKKDPTPRYDIDGHMVFMGGESSLYIPLR